MLNIMNSVKLNKKINFSFENFITKIELSNLDDFLIHNFISINETVTIYYSLKKVFNDTDNDLSYYNDFQKTFYQFYGINRFTSDEFKKRYFDVLCNLRTDFHKSEINLYEFVKHNMIDSTKDGRKIIQFSFATKALNLYNDKEYPIYDNNVNKVLKLNQDFNSKNEDERINMYIENLYVIKGVYEKFLLSNTCKGIIKDFRNKFKYADETISDLRIIDFLVWKIGDQFTKK